MELNFIIILFQRIKEVKKLFKQRIHQPQDSYFSLNCLIVIIFLFYHQCIFHKYLIIAHSMYLSYQVSHLAYLKIQFINFFLYLFQLKIKKFLYNHNYYLMFYYLHTLHINLQQLSLFLIQLRQIHLQIIQSISYIH